MGVAVVADKNASTHEDVNAARRAAEADASNTQNAEQLPDPAVAEEAKRVLERLSVYSEP